MGSSTALRESSPDAVLWVVPRTAIQMFSAVRTVEGLVILTDVISATDESAVSMKLFFRDARLFYMSITQHDLQLVAVLLNV